MADAQVSDGTAVADRVVLTYRILEDDGDGWGAPSSRWLQRRLTDETYVSRLKRSHAGPITVDDEWNELLHCGCEKPRDVVISVESVHGGDELAESTELELRRRDDGGLE